MRGHITATNRFVCTGEFLWKSLSLQQNFVAATSRTNSVWFDFLRLVAATKFRCRDKDFPKNSPVHTKRFVVATCRLTVLLQRVAATCCLVCTDLYWLIDKFENMNTWSVDFWLTASEAICCISGSRHKVLNWNATILFSLICCKMALFSSSSFVNSSIPAGGFLREFVNDFWL